MSAIDWARVKDLIQKSERHSRRSFDCDSLSLEEWRELDRVRFLIDPNYAQLTLSLNGWPAKKLGFLDGE